MEAPTKDVKYLQKAGSELKLFFSLSDLKKITDASMPLIHVEGEKKALCVAQGIEKQSLNAACVSIPGVWNWAKKKEDGEEHKKRELADIYDEIPLQGRKVFFAPDSGFFTNPHENKACKEILTLIFSRGADIRIVDLRIPGEEKIGADDYIVKRDFEAFWKACLNPIWSLKKHDLNYIPSNLGPEAADKILENSILLGEIESDFLCKKLAQQTGLPQGKISKELQKKRIQFQKTTNTRNESIFVWNAQTTTVEGVLKYLGSKISGLDDFFIDPDTDTLLVQKKDKIERVITGDSLSHKMADLVHFQRQNGKDLSGYRHVPTEICSSLLHKLDKFSTLRGLKHHLTTPAYLGGEIISTPGYFAKQMALYVGKEVKPSQGLFHTKKLLETFPFALEVDEVNALGALLSIFFRGEFIGRHPMILVAGDDQNLGKTTLVQCMAIIASGTTIRDITYTDNEEELEKRFATELLSSDYLFLDNVKTSGVIRNQALEALLTAPVVNFRLLGGNTSLSRANNILTFCTVNHARLAPDLVVRSLAINLTHKNRHRMPDGLDFDPMEYAREHRGEILSELLGLVDLWIKKDSKKVPVKFPKYPQFAAILNGILSGSGQKGFLSNYEATAMKLDAITTAFLDMVGLGLEESGEKKTLFRSPKEWRVLFQESCSNNLLRDYPTEKSQDSFFGRMLAKLHGKTIPYETLEGDSWPLHILSQRNVRRNSTALDYAFEFQPPELGPSGDSKNNTSTHHNTSENDPNRPCVVDISSVNTEGKNIPQHFNTSLTQFDQKNKNIFSPQEAPKNDHPCVEVSKPLSCNDYIHNTCFWDGRHMGEAFAFDTETTLIEHPGKVPEFILGSAFNGHETVFLKREDLKKFTELHLNSTWIMHNASFDLSVLSEVLGIREPIFQLIDNRKIVTPCF